MSTEIQKVSNTVWLMPVNPKGFTLYAEAFDLILNRFGFHALCRCFKLFFCTLVQEKKSQLWENRRLSIDNIAEITIDFKTHV